MTYSEAADGLAAADLQELEPVPEAPPEEEQTITPTMALQVLTQRHDRELERMAAIHTQQLEQVRAERDQLVERMTAERDELLQEIRELTGRVGELTGQLQILEQRRGWLQRLFGR